jgi:predicted transcriptional regulator
MIPNNSATFDDDIAAVLREGALVICFQRACDALRDRRLDHKERSVLAVLLESMNSETGTAWPSRELIAERLFVSVKTVMNALYELKRLGYVDWERRPLQGGRPLIQYTVPLARFDREALQLAIAEAIIGMRNAPDAGHKKVPRPQGTSQKTALYSGQENARPAGHTPPAGHETAPYAGQESAPPRGQQELTKELTKGTKEYGPNLRSDLLGQLADEKPKKKRNEYPEDFMRFFAAYPDTEGMSKKEAFGEWKKLDVDDRAWAVAALPAFIAKNSRRSSDATTLHAVRYLKYRRFEGFSRDAAPTTDAWWKDSAKLAAMTLDRWRVGISKFANGIWHVHELGPPPGDPKCVVPRALIDELRLTEKYNEHGLARGKH